MDEIILPDDIFHYLTTYLPLEDCMSLCLSSVFERYADFYARRRIWKLSWCSSLKPDICQTFFSTCLKSSNVHVLDFSHCFWLPEATLLQSCLSPKLSYLKELSLSDTQLSLASIIIYVLPQCQSLTKLSANIPEHTWEAFHGKLEGCADTYKENFKKLTHIKFYVLHGSSPLIWLLLFNVLGWCKDCVKLHIKLIEQPRQNNWDLALEDVEASSNAVVCLAKENLYDGMKWMISLKSIVVLKTSSDSCLNDFCRWLLFELNPPGLEKMFIQSVKHIDAKYKPGPMLNYFYLGRSPVSRTFFSQMTHLFEINITRNLILPRLRFFSGNFSSVSILDEFCRNHPQLEHVHFTNRVFGGNRRKKPITFQCQWAFPKLRTLVFGRKRPHHDVLIKFMDSCSNLEELLIGEFFDYAILIFNRRPPVRDSFDCIAKQRHLRKLSLNSIEFVNGSFIETVLENCQKLEILHLAGQFFEDSVPFHDDFCKYLPLGKHLRDLRIQREEMEEPILMELISAAGSCPSLERFMLYQYRGLCVNNELHLILPKCLMNLVSVRLPRLLVFCLIYRLGRETFTAITDAFREHILPMRPSFWFYLNDTLPSEINVPRIHFEGIIEPDSITVFG
ncbi:uncharacterized protein LOC130698466 [Daphnia carinata]|uniref:uncharacterized protein LOC130698466 n=1 Tax=Daphnia carinata TaxID=120202 RepID=UPI00257A842C|nr:uncharacterized protein LOC130698466 [Daphnia carinata]